MRPGTKKLVADAKPKMLTAKRGNIAMIPAVRKSAAAGI
jgi:hypothetical protein